MSLAPSEMKSSGNSSFWFVQFSIVTPTAFWTQIVRIFSLETLWRGPAYQMAWRYAEWQDGISLLSFCNFCRQHHADNPKTACHDTFLHRLALAASANPSSKKTTQELSNNLQSVDKQGLTLDTTHTHTHKKRKAMYTIPLKAISRVDQQQQQQIKSVAPEHKWILLHFLFWPNSCKNEMEKFHYIRMILHTLSISNHLVGLPNPHYFQVSWRIWLLTIPLGSQVGSITNLIQLLLSTLLQEKHFGLDFSRFKIFTILPDKTNSPQIMGSRNPE